MRDDETASRRRYGRDQKMRIGQQGPEAGQLAERSVGG
ncbi:hypothetical protein P873_05540 [Arenimonas composti TR7-09 = DSM 18010]|uniref:Uncharacterized protein n=1 Tax=Arenimonas composti TR7-09 = DSM 18010 TaxID=1121013 RepID=A0A091BD68_9GAMM|nr:hypothetical protein P873_05540 [Arenimonas composti TR7-09 = DSM 18010]